MRVQLPALAFRSLSRGALSHLCKPTHAVALLAVALTAACGGSSQEAAAPETEEPVALPQAATGEPADDSDGTNDPERTVKKLNEQFDVAARNGTATEEAQAFIRKHETGLTRLYVDERGALSPKTRVVLINLLVSFQTEATAPAHAAAISGYADGEASVDEGIWACQAAKKLKSPALADALMKAFKAIDMSEADGQRFGRHLGDAMEWNVVPSWSAELEKHRDAPITSPDSFDDKVAVRKYRNQKYWQETSVRLLERLRTASAP
jgi:hypothetical protein